MKVKRSIKVRKGGVPKDYQPKSPVKADEGATNATPKRLTIESASNGYITRHEPPPTSDGDGGYKYQPDIVGVHSPDSPVGQFMQNMFSGTPDDAADRRKSAAKSVLKGKASATQS